MNRIFQIPGYSAESQAAFDAVIGKLPESRWSELSVTAQALFALVVINRNPSKYKNSDGCLKKSFNSLVREIVGGRSRNWSTAALRREWLISQDLRERRQARYKVTPCGNLSAVLRDVALYYQDPNALTSEQWKVVNSKIDLLNGDPDLDSDAMIAAVAYGLSKVVGFNQP